MSNADTPVLAPKALILPDIAGNETDIQTGAIGISGAVIRWYDGSAWRELSGSNTGD